MSHYFDFQWLEMILMSAMIVFGRFLLLKHGDMERKATWQWWCFCWKECRLYCHITRLWAPEILSDPKHHVTWAVIRAHTTDVESRTTVLWGWGPYSDSGGRGYLLPDWSLEEGCPISLTGSRGGDITTQELIDHHCAPGMRKLGNKIPIRPVTDGPLWTILFTMQRVAES